MLVWAIAAVAAGLGLNFLLKKEERSKDKMMKYHVLGVLVLSYGLSVLWFYLFKDAGHMALTSRLVFLVLGGVNAWVVWKRPWSKRHTWDAEEDSVWPEALFSLLAGLVMAVAYVTAPQSVELVSYATDLSAIYWDAPLVFLLPFWAVKVLDLAGQIPFPHTPHPLVFSIEEISTEEWQWVQLQQCTFDLYPSLEKEGQPFARRSQPWVEVPASRTLEEVFKLMVQERRKRNDLSTLQDFGDEYAGKPEFCWIFWLQAPWYYVPGWFEKRRYVDPSSTIQKLNMAERDKIRAMRLPSYVPTFEPPKNTAVSTPADPNATVIIKR